MAAGGIYQSGDILVLRSHSLLDFWKGCLKMVYFSTRMPLGGVLLHLPAQFLVEESHVGSRD